MRRYGVLASFAVVMASVVGCGGGEKDAPAGSDGAGGTAAAEASGGTGGATATASGGTGVAGDGSGGTGVGGDGAGGATTGSSTMGSSTTGAESGATTAGAASNAGGASTSGGGTSAGTGTTTGSGGTVGGGGTASVTEARGELMGETACELLEDCCKQATVCPSISSQDIVCVDQLFNVLSSLHCGPVVTGEISVEMDFTGGGLSFACDLAGPPRGAVNGIEDVRVAHSTGMGVLTLDCTSPAATEIGAVSMTFPAALGQHPSGARAYFRLDNILHDFRGEDGVNGAELVTDVESHDPDERRWRGTFRGSFPQNVNLGDDPLTITVDFDVQTPRWPLE